MYAMACLTDKYLMTINYEEGQIVTFVKKEKVESENVYDIFPPMMFCKAASEESRKYICHANSYDRREIIVDLMYENLNQIPITERILNILNNKSGKQQEYLLHMLEEMSFGLDKLF